MSTETVKLTIDATEVMVPKGTTIFEAARQLGIEIPHLCYSPELGLPPTSSCRLCLVEIEGMKAPVTSCSYPVAQDMVVHTDSDNLREMRRAVVELILSDHPHDCLTCEKAGDCTLQRYAYELGVKESPYRSETVRCSPVQNGPAIVYDRSKCVLCGRCVMVCHDVQVVGAIDFQGRGFGMRVDLPPGQQRSDSVCEECGNCIDVCPTGALSVASIEKLGRTWELERVETICPYCGVGCSMVLHIRGGRIVKVTGSPGLGLNAGRLCVKGRFGFDFVAHEERLTTPLIRRNGKLVSVSWNEALEFVADRLISIRKQFGPDAVGVLASAKCTNEDNYLIQKFARAVIGTNNIDHCARLCHASTVAGLAMAFGSGAMTNPIEDLAKAKAIFVIGSNTTECHPVVGAIIKRAAVSGTSLIVADPRWIELVEFAQVWLRQRHGTDTALINGIAREILQAGLEDKEFISQRTEGFEEFRASVEAYTLNLTEAITGVPSADITRAARIYAEAENASIVYSMGITQHTTGTNNVLALANLAMLTGNVGKPGAGVNPLRGQNNVQGACDMGALPNLFPGYQRVDDEQVRSKFEKAWGISLPAKPGLTAVEMIKATEERHIRALYIMGENPMLSDPDIAHVEKALRQLDLLVVQDIFLTETAELADVVLPSAGFAEKEGTFTNTERRVQRVRKAVDPPGMARLDWEILCDLSHRMGQPMSYPDCAAIQDEIASLTPSYAGITYDRLEKTSIQWPCPERNHPGTPILHVDKFTRGLGKFHPVEFLPPEELPDNEYPFILSTGRILEHFHTGTMSRRSRVLHQLVPVGVVEINPSDANQLGIRTGDLVKISSRRGEIEIGAEVTDRVTPGSVFLAFHYREAPANRLTIAALDPIAKIPELKVCAVRIEPTKEVSSEPCR